MLRRISILLFVVSVLPVSTASAALPTLIPRTALLGASPLGVIQTRRLHFAKQLVKIYSARGRCQRQDFHPGCFQGSAFFPRSVPAADHPQGALFHSAYQLTSERQSQARVENEAYRLAAVLGGSAGSEHRSDSAPGWSPYPEQQARSHALEQMAFGSDNIGFAYSLPL